MSTRTTGCAGSCTRWRRPPSYPWSWRARRLPTMSVSGLPGRPSKTRARTKWSRKAGCAASARTCSQTAPNAVSAAPPTATGAPAPWWCSAAGAGSRRVTGSSSSRSTGPSARGPCSGPTTAGAAGWSSSGRRGSWGPARSGRSRLRRSSKSSSVPSTASRPAISACGGSPPC